MRDIAQGVGISAAALYHHFPDKETLYQNAVRYVFLDKTLPAKEALQNDGPTELRLKRFIRELVQLFGSNPEFRKLQQRALLESDVERLKTLATVVFEEDFVKIVHILEELLPQCDAHMLLFSISGMIIHHFEVGTVRRLFPGSRAEHDDFDYITEFFTGLLLRGLDGIKRA